MGVEWNSDANSDIPALLKSWKAAHKKYVEQISEANRRGTPRDHMQGCADQLWECIHNLERAIGVTKANEFKKTPNEKGQS